MSNYVIREKFEDALREEFEMGVSDVWEAVRNALDRSEVEVEPIADEHASWIPVQIGDDQYMSHYRCSICGEIISGPKGRNPYNDVPVCKCGARMIQEDKRWI